MRAIHLPAFAPNPSLLTPSSIPTPTPKEDEYLIRVTHCSPQHADILHAQGKHQNNNAKRGFVHPPFVLGFDFAGVIQSGPSESDGRGLEQGDRVFGAALGAFAEFVCAKSERIRRVPEGLGSEVACAASGQAVSYAAVVEIAKVARGETVLVSGASGGLGSVCCSVAKAAGARVIALAGDEEKARVMRGQMGVEVVVMQGEWVKEVLGVTGGQGVDAVMDNTGMVNDALRCLAYGGRIVILGFAARKGVMEEVKMNKLLLKSATVIGYRFGESGRRHPSDLERTWEGYLKMLESGHATPMLYGNYNGLEDIGRALGDLAERKVHGKIVVKIADDKDTEKAKL
ncbi:hypothetical protein MBLNU230_g2399t1 [Neophaeotheca triangularis]